MKKTVLAALTTGLFVLSTSASAMDSDLENRLVDICEAAKTDSPIRLITEMKQNRLRFDTVAEGLMCNGVDVITFAKMHGAENTARVIAARASSQNSSVTIQDLAKNNLKK